jgi:hypothetical protein
LRPLRWVLSVLVVASATASIAMASAGGTGRVAQISSSSSEVPGDWWNAVRTSIGASEYDVSFQEGTALPVLPSSLQAPNRAHGLRTHFTPSGIRVVPRTEPVPSWDWGLHLARYGFGGALVRTAAADPVASGNRVEYRRGGLTEWYLNDDRGLEQGFTFTTPPPAPAGRSPGHLLVDLAVGGSLVPAQGPGAVAFSTSSGHPVLSYTGLFAFDATGRSLPAELKLVPSDLTNGRDLIRITVQVAGATFPVIIDPVARGPAWTGESDQDTAWYGYSVRTAGDVDSDGFDDVIVGAYRYDNGNTNEGKAFLYMGSPSGPSTTPDWTAEGDQEGLLFGHDVGTAGDVNGDGYGDVIVGAPNPDHGNKIGQAYIYYGSPTGLSTVADWVAQGGQTRGWFGRRVGTAGDVNGDGYADVVVGMPHYHTDLPNVGRAVAYYGSPDGPALRADWIVDGDQAGALFGRSLGRAGDVTGDGYDDVIVGAHYYDNGERNEGRAFVYYGGAAGLSTTPAWVEESDQVKAVFGRSVGTAGDVNSDGYDDVIVGAPNYDSDQTDEGVAFVYHGSAAGLSTTPDWTGEARQEDAWFGRSVARAGDVNGDGYGDVIVGAPNYDTNQPDGGKVFLYHGSAGGLSALPDWSSQLNQANAWFGRSVARAGDVNGDGYGDLIVGAPQYDKGQTDEGGAFLFYGSGAGVARTPTQAPDASARAPDWTVEADQDKAWLGYTAATAGDVNADGWDDVIVGAYRYDEGEPNEGKSFAFYGSPSGLSTTPDWTAAGDLTGAWFGHSVSTAGDVNADGYDDVIVGAPNPTHGTTIGLALVYHGSPSGLSATADWTAQGEQPVDWFGRRVHTAGDVNADGYADVIVGAPHHDTDLYAAGKAYAYYGSPGGLSATADWTDVGDQNGVLFGRDGKWAGDVNGDGYDDVIVGAHFYRNGQVQEGRAYLYHGSPRGLRPSPGWVAEGDQPGGWFGRSVSTAGDVNGDGYDDVIVGAPKFDGGEMDEGRAFLYHGSAGGLSTTASWTAEADQSQAWFGRAVSTAGDVNGDGYGDVIVGAPNYNTGRLDGGKAFVYYGSAGGLSTLADWTAQLDQTQAWFGRSVARAGDVNADGYDDLIIGAPKYDHGETDEGGAFLFYGSSIGPSEI